MFTIENQKAFTMLLRDEGYRQKPYFDTTGHVTIGLGWNLTEHGLPDEVLLGLAHYSIVNAKRDAAAFCSASIFSTLSENRRLAIINLAFNLGYPKLAEFHGLKAAIHAKDWPRAAESVRSSLYAKQVGDRAERIAIMLEKDINLYE